LLTTVVPVSREQASKPADADQFDRLPDEVLLHLFSFLPDEATLARLELVSKRWQHGAILLTSLPLFPFCAQSLLMRN
jgi:hypothetical protein